jgi:hypothetical protein
MNYPPHTSNTIVPTSYVDGPLPPPISTVRPRKKEAIPRGGSWSTSSPVSLVPSTRPPPRYSGADISILSIYQKKLPRLAILSLSLVRLRQKMIP